MSASKSLRRSRHLKLREINHRFYFGFTAHFKRRLEACTHGRTLGLAEDFAAEMVVELNAFDEGRFAIRHPRNWARDRWGGAAGGTVWAALESHGRDFTALGV
jgi:hypothetical protein